MNLNKLQKITSFLPPSFYDTDIIGYHTRMGLLAKDQHGYTNYTPVVPDDIREEVIFLQKQKFFSHLTSATFLWHYKVEDEELQIFERSLEVLSEKLSSYEEFGLIFFNQTLYFFSGEINESLQDFHDFIWEITKDVTEGIDADDDFNISYDELSRIHDLLEYHFFSYLLYMR